jgi:penicillin-binding protein 1A
MSTPEERPPRRRLHPVLSISLRVIFWITLLAGGLVISGALLLMLATALAYKNLPPIDSLTDYRPKIPLRVYTADNVLIGEFGEERRNVVRIGDVPLVMKQAILAAEDDRFYQHGGIDYAGVLRAAITNALRGTAFGGGRRQGASTITQQVARNFFLSSEQSYTRKFYEVLMAFKIESTLTKDQILEVYINQIYLGQRAYGFSSAERVYFGKALKDITPGEAAMLAGLPRAPSTYNPIVNPERARARQHYVLNRMLNLGFLTDEEYKKALDEKPGVKVEGTEFSVHAEYVAEMARQIAYDQFKEETYTRGLNIYTTLISTEQNAAYAALRNGVLAYERRHSYEGPEGFADLPTKPEELDQAIEDALLEYTDSDDLLAAVVLDATPKVVHAARQGETYEISGDGLKFAAQALSDKALPTKRIRRGAIIRIAQNSKGAWEILELPQIQAALVAASCEDGAVHALVGGFDFNRNKFNHVTQAWRQPGSSFKPFVYSAALEKGFTPATIVNDAPVVVDAALTGSQTWEPKNYDNKYDGPITLRQALQRSKNMVSIRILQYITPKYVQNYIGRFGFDPEKHPAYLPMALGAGSVTPWQMLGAYSVFANGGYKINPFFISRITDSSGQVLAKADPALAGSEANRVIDVRNAYVMDSLLKSVARAGTAAPVTVALKRHDLAGKTGTTNESRDAWFAGYSNQNLVGIAWIGFDQPKSLGDRETGGGLALPLWVSYMQEALKGAPEKDRVMPPGVVNVGGEVFYTEFQPGQGGIATLGLDQGLPGDATPGALPDAPPAPVTNFQVPPGPVSPSASASGSAAPQGVPPPPPPPPAARVPSTPPVSATPGNPGRGENSPTQPYGTLRN